MLYKILFLIGLALMITGQSLFLPGNDFVYSLRPIDFAHWSLFMGSFLMIPQIVTFPKKWPSITGTPLALAGAVCMIGMCVLDFIWWSMPNQEMRNELAGHLIQVDVIWKPFIKDGPNLLNMGLFVLSLNFLKDKKLGVAVVFLATLVIFVIPVPFRLIVGYSLSLIGFGLIFLKD